METVLDSSILSASEYNRIKSFEEQPTISENHLTCIGHLFVKNQMHHYYGTGTLHRHNLLHQGHAMVHTLRDGDTDICKAEHVKDSNFHPHSFCLNSREQFQAYEYESEANPTRPLPSEDFLCQMRDYLIRNSLADRVAIQAEDSREDSIEFLLPDQRGTVSVPQRGSGIRQAITTGWKFCEQPDGQIRIIERRKCVSQGDGQHYPKPDD